MIQTETVTPSAGLRNGVIDGMVDGYIQPRGPGRPRKAIMKAQEQDPSQVVENQAIDNAEGKRVATRQSKRRASISSTGSNGGTVSKIVEEPRSVKRQNCIIDLKKLDLVSLKRYKRIYKVRVKPGSSKLQLLHAIQEHHQNLELEESDVVSRFIERIQSEHNIQDMQYPYYDDLE
jgi:hypothetical protein